MKNGVFSLFFTLVGLTTVDMSSISYLTLKYKDD